MTGDEASHRLPRLRRDRRRRRIAADDLPGQSRDDLSGLHGSRPRSGRLRAGRPRRDAFGAGGRQRREGRADLHPGEHRAGGRGGRRPRQGDRGRGAARRRQAADAAAKRDRGARSLARAGQGHAGAIEPQPRPHADAVRQEVGVEGPARRGDRPARPERGRGRRSRAPHHRGQAAEPLRPDRCRGGLGRDRAAFLGAGREGARQAARCSRRRRGRSRRSISGRARW